MHEKRISEHENFQDTIVFQTNTNASLLTLDTQIGQLALNIQNQSKRECMAVLLRSGRELDK